MAVTCENNSLEFLTEYPPMRCDSHFRQKIKLSEKFFQNDKVSWVSLGSILSEIKNGMNISTSYYSMEPTSVLYISVSQIKEHGLISKNQSYLIDDTKDLKSFFELRENTVLITRSGTVGVAISTDHHSFQLDDYTYVPSGFVIAAIIEPEYSASVIANYINLFEVQNYLAAMASGACQKNISQPTIQSLPIPEVLLTQSERFETIFAQYEKSISDVLASIRTKELEINTVKNHAAEQVIQMITNLS